MTVKARRFLDSWASKTSWVFWTPQLTRSQATLRRPINRTMASGWEETVTVVGSPAVRDIRVVNERLLPKGRCGSAFQSAPGSGG